MKPNSKRTLTLWIVIAAAMTLLLSACSIDSSPVAANNQTSDPQTFQYPAFDPTNLNDGPAPGFRFVKRGSNALDVNPCDTMQTSRFCQANRDNSVRIDHLVEIRIPRDALQSDETVTLVAPQGCWAVVDFYPHPYQFNCTVEIRWKVKDLGLPRDFDYDSLVPWYVTDSGDYQPLPYEWHNGHDELRVYTNHFSRYILGAPISAN